MRKQRTRKARALRRLLPLGICLFLLGQLYPVTPRAALRQTEILFNTGPTTVIWETKEFPVEPSYPSRLLFSVNERALVVVLAQYWPGMGYRGWQSNYETVARCGGEGSLHAGLLRADGACYLFGRVDDHAAMTLRVRLGGWMKEAWAPGYPFEPPEVWKTFKTLDIPRTQWFHAQEGTYFIQLVLTEDEAPVNRFVEAQVELLDGEGRVLAQSGSLKD